MSDKRSTRGPGPQPAATGGASGGIHSRHERGRVPKGGTRRSIPPYEGWSRLLTESRNPRSRRLDTLPTEKVVALLLDEDRRALVAAARERRSLTQGAEELARALEAGGRVVFLGAGTSGRLAVLEAAECPPTFGTDPDRIQAVIAGGEGAVFRAVEGAEDREDNGLREGGQLSANDVLVGISASSVTPF